MKVTAQSAKTGSLKLLAKPERPDLLTDRASAGTPATLPPNVAIVEMQILDTPEPIRDNGQSGAPRTS